ncbi:NUDIX hydrolase [Maribacter ulvicola]|uniref:NrtR DNA-binding winged helix domain-containing protein n=1 Tax=Maribacter ulvicola TaxID=228959 RepID=A0A1N6S310_9FLAO|nr:NUDIX domain-containing protein [Maribacter ulvicola]SIQ35356.1 hypothetical protein SAMN05421797_1011493 [Maribacter ulvicola]
MTLNNYRKEDKVLLSIECIIYGFYQDELKILLIQREFGSTKDRWSLIGDFLKNEEELNNAASRIVNQLTGLNNMYMEQVHSYSKPDHILEEKIISVSYIALINIENYCKNILKENPIKWFAIKDIPSLVFDHNKMIKDSLALLRNRISNRPIAFELLPEKFTMRQLQKIYEVILGTELDKRNFINKFNSLDLLNKLNEKDMTSSKKGAFLFEFDEVKYLRKVAEGFCFKV